MVINKNKAENIQDTSLNESSDLTAKVEFKADVVFMNKIINRSTELLKMTLDGNFLPEELQDDIEQFLNNLKDE